MKQDLEKVRNEIDAIDQKILGLLEDRLRRAEEVARIKESQEVVALTDPTREQEIIERLQGATENQVLQAEVENIFSICMDMSKRVRVIRIQQEKNRYLPNLRMGVPDQHEFVWWQILPLFLKFRFVDR